MNNILRSIYTGALAVALFASAGTVSEANAASAKDLQRDASQALELLISTNPTAASISDQSTAVLIFPSIVKAGLVFGAAYGEGLLQHDQSVDSYYNSFTGSWGLQIGGQSYGYAVFLMNDGAIDYIRESKGWEIGVGPTVVFMNEGAAKNLSSSSLQADAYAFIFDQSGMMIGISIEGTKISEIQR